MYHNLDDVVVWLKIIAALQVLMLAAFLIFRNPQQPKVVSPDTKDYRESWKPFPGYDGTQEPP